MAPTAHLKLVGLLIASGALAAGCGGSSSTTASVAGTTVSATVPGTTATLPAASSVAQAATSAAGGAASSVGDELRQRLGSSLPGLDAVIDEVEQEDDGTVTVHTSLGADDPLATVAKNQCDAARQAIGSSATNLLILGSDGSTIASC
jgi:basic membrane lipoprotein Med (substrate-binding protein (PBP1-ABC) superfamily)